MFWFDLELYGDSSLLHNLVSGEGGKNYSGVLVWLGKGAESPVALLRVVSTAVSSWKNSCPNWRRHHVAVDHVLVMFSGGRIVHASAVSSSLSLSEVAPPPLKTALCSTAIHEARG